MGAGGKEGHGLWTGLQGRGINYSTSHIPHFLQCTLPPIPPLFPQHRASSIHPTKARPGKYCSWYTFTPLTLHACKRCTQSYAKASVFLPCHTHTRYSSHARNQNRAIITCIREHLSPLPLPQFRPWDRPNDPEREERSWEAEKMLRPGEMKQRRGGHSFVSF